MVADRGGEERILAQPELPVLGHDRGQLAAASGDGAACGDARTRTAAMAASMVTSGDDGDQARKRLFTTKRTLAGRSASRRMYQGNQYEP